MLLHLLTAGFGTTRTSCDVRFCAAIGGRADVRQRAGTAAFDVVDGARSRHRSAIAWFVGDESHEWSRPHANYHYRVGYREERVPGSWHRRDREGRGQEAASSRSGDEVFGGAAALPGRHGGLCHGTLLGARVDEARAP